MANSPGQNEHDTLVSISSDTVIVNVINQSNNYTIMLTNACSQLPKINSLQIFFEGHKVDINLVTESWLHDGHILDRDVIDLEYGINLKILYKNRA